MLKFPEGYTSTQVAKRRIILPSLQPKKKKNKKEKASITNVALLWLRILYNLNNSGRVATVQRKGPV